MFTVNIYNEAGTAIIATGSTVTDTVPVVVTNINNPGVIVKHHEYQVEVVGGVGGRVGRLCEEKGTMHAAPFARFA